MFPLQHVDKVLLYDHRSVNRFETIKQENMLLVSY